MKTKVVKKKKGIILGGCLLAVAAVAVAVTSFSSIPVKSELVKKGEVVRLVEESGIVESKNTVIVTAKNGGEVNAVLVEEGTFATAGTRLMESDISSAEMDIKSLQAQLSGLQTQYARAKSTLEKNKKLYEQGALSQEEYNASAAGAKQLSSEISALSYTIKSSEEASGVSGVTAPIDGTLTEVFVQKGEIVAAGAALFELSDLKQLYVKVELIAEDADLVAVGDLVRVYNENTGFSDANCTVRKIFTKAQEELSELGIKQRRVAVEVALNPSTVLRLGSNMDVEITVDKKEAVLCVPDEAFFEIEGKDYVYVIEKEKAVLKEVEIGLEGEEYFEVLSGVAEGDRVVISPSDEIEEGTKVRIESTI
ncbi:MAG: efflux RND transporter periplasmic adaptor subunit [Eubacteriales bacterium]|nr:efflux RND transporter periplasmic adaptor subunit [Eubacteriales bacterium]